MSQQEEDIAVSVARLKADLVRNDLFPPAYRKTLLIYRPDLEAVLAQLATLQAERDRALGALEKTKEDLRRIYRGCEMSAAIMRDPSRTGGWSGAENTARAFDSYSRRAKERYDALAALSLPVEGGLGTDANAHDHLSSATDETTGQDGEATRTGGEQA